MSAIALVESGWRFDRKLLGKKKVNQLRCISTLTHPDTAVVGGMGTGTIAELILSGELKKPGVWAIEQALSTELFDRAMQSRGIEIQQQLME